MGTEEASLKQVEQAQKAATCMGSNEVFLLRCPPPAAGERK